MNLICSSNKYVVNLVIWDVFLIVLSEAYTMLCKEEKNCCIVCHFMVKLTLNLSEKILYWPRSVMLVQFVVLWASEVFNETG